MPTEKSQRPNIIVILVDDMGFSDIGCCGSEINTPNLDRLGDEGVIFSGMYNCARCCPTRASLLTGLYPHTAGVGHMVNNLGITEYQGYLSDRCVTIAEALKLGGYRTLMSGKWHVGGYYSTDASSWRPGEVGHPMPIQRGFDEHWGTLSGAGSYFWPHTLIHDDTFIDRPDDGFYLTDAISEHACEMIDRAVNDEQPFFLYAAYTAPHWPLQAWEEDIERYRGKYAQGWDALRTSRHEEMKGKGIVNEKWEITPRDETVPPWEDIQEQTWESLRMAVYAAQVDRLDQGIGQLLDKLEERGIADNTLVMFLSDNGGCAELLREDGPRGSVRGETLDGHTVKLGNYVENTPGDADSFMSYDTQWANASNTPFRLYKHWVHEGGISTPLLVRWPERIKAGHMVHSPAHVIDIMATCLDAAGVAYPDEYDNREIAPLEGESLIPACTLDGWKRARPIFWEHEGNCAVRMENWKLVKKFPGAWELYDMIEDRTELNDLASANVPQTQRMVEAYERYAERTNVLPWERVLDIYREMRKG